MLAIPRSLGARCELTRIGANRWFGQGEGGDFSPRASREKPLLLLLRSKESDRLGNADRLMGRQQRRSIGAVRTDHLHDTHVLVMGQAESGVLSADLHAEGAEFRQAIEDVLWVLAGPIDRDGIDLSFQKRGELFVEAFKVWTFSVVPRVGFEQLGAEVTVEEVAEKAPSLPALLASGLGFAA